MRFKIVLLLGVIAIITSCKVNKMQLVTLECDKLNKDTTWVYQDSIVKITYFYYTRNGKLNFTIANISDKPIFFDGKNSFLLIGNQKFAYWSDVAFINGTSYGYVTKYRNSYSSMNAVEVKEERMVLIPPNSSLNRSNFYIHDINLYDLKNYPAKNDSVAVNWKTNSTKKTAIKKVEFQKGNTPLSFRNYITLSRTEDLKAPIYYDFSFWASSIWQMDARQAIKSKNTEKYAEGWYKEGNYPNAQFHPYKKPWMFYLNDISILQN